MELALVFVLGMGLVAYLVVKAMTKIGRGMRSFATGGLVRGKKNGGFFRKLIWLFVRLLGLVIAAALWSSSVLVRPFLLALLFFVVFKAYRRYAKFMSNATTVTDALLFREVQTQVDRTWSTFPTTTYVDPRGNEHFPKIEGWHWVYSVSGDAFGIQASIKAAEGSSLGAIDDLTAQPGAKDERLASTLNAHLDSSRSLTGVVLGDKVPRFAAVDVQTTLERIQTLTPGEVPEVRSGEGVITLMRRDPLWETVELPFPLYSQTWDRVPLPLIVHLGVDRWAQPVSVPLTRMRIMARSGWGKSRLLDTLLANLVYYPPRKVIIILIDCKWGMHHLKWAPCVDVLVTHPDRATEVCKAVADQMDIRAAKLKAQGLEDLPEATEELPLIVVIADEAQKLPWSKGKGPLLAMDYFIKFYQEGRALGIMPIMTLQYGTAATFPRDIAMNIEIDIAGKLRDRSGSNVAMGDDVVDKSFGPHCIVDTPLNRGVFALKTDMGLGTYMKCFNTVPEAKTRLVNHYGMFKRPHYAWLPSYQDEAFFQDDEDEEPLELTVTDEEWDALVELAAAALIQPEDIIISEIPQWLAKSKQRLSKARYAAISEALSALIDDDQAA